MSAGSLWARLAIGVAASVGTLALVPVPPPGPERTGAGVAVAGGTALGVLLFAALARARPRLPRRDSITAGQACFLVGWACVEEILWRRLLLGSLVVVAGTEIGLVAATGLFALAHREGRAAQVATGATFGAAYLVTGRLATAVASHAAYNLLVAGSRLRCDWRAA